MNRRGNTIVIAPIIIIISIVAVIVVGAILVNVVMPLILQQKLNKISEKYMFIVEKFGYLTASEKQSLLNELNNSGFDTNNLIIKAPNSRKTYGELIEFSILYKAKYNVINFKNGKINIESKPINISVRKCSYSKI